MGKMNNEMKLKILKLIAVFAFAGGAFYAVFNYRLDAVEVDVKAVEVDVETVENTFNSEIANLYDDIDYNDDRLHDQEREVFGIKKDIGSLSDKVDRNYSDQQNFQIEQKTLSKEILKELRK